MHFIRGQIQDGVIDMQFCPSSEQVADIFTKPFTEQKFCLIEGHSRSEGYINLAVEHVSIIFLLATYFEGGVLFPYLTLFSFIVCKNVCIHSALSFSFTIEGADSCILERHILRLLGISNAIHARNGILFDIDMVSTPTYLCCLEKPRNCVLM
jgi:hypothetical protein